MYVFDINNASITITEYENGSRTGMRAIISCYNLDLNLDTIIPDYAEEEIKALFSFCSMNNGADVLVWNDNTDALKGDVEKLSTYLTEHSARFMIWTADSEEQFESWFTEHKKFVNFIVEENGGNFKCGDPDNCMWVHRAYPLRHDTDAWVIAMVNSSGDMIRIFKTKSSVYKGGDWYESVRRQNALTSAFALARKKIEDYERAEELIKEFRSFASKSSCV